ncbi:MAG TPA: hypothetical protein VNH17_08005 [Streptosporangiaceae bacterium]|nr:hypothetical protein [Streptosporangiaceae bacterium]
MRPDPPVPGYPDPRWDWHEVTAAGDRERRYVRGMCRHLETAPVESAGGGVVAYLCVTCCSELEAG